MTGRRLSPDEERRLTPERVKASRENLARLNVEDWQAKNAGFTGGFRIWTGEDNTPPPSTWYTFGDKNEAEKVIESTRQPPIFMPPDEYGQHVIDPRDVNPNYFLPWWKKLWRKLRGK